MRRVSICLIVLALIAWPATVVLAGPPPLPSNFWGTVTLNGAQAPAGARVSARVQGVECGFATVAIDPVYGAVYTLSVSGDDSETPDVDGGNPGDMVLFVLELPGGGSCPMPQVGIWSGGMSVSLDLAFMQGTPMFVLPLILVGS